MSNQKSKNQIVIGEYKQYRRLKWLSFIFAGLFFIGIIFGGYYIYTNIYEAIAKTEAALLFDPGLNQESINFDQYEKVKKNWAEKLDAKNLIIERDPFNPATSTSTSSTIDKKA